MKRSLILSVLLLAFFAAFAQHKRSDTLRLALIKAPTDTAKFVAMKDLGNLYYSNQPDSAIIFDQQSFLIAKKKQLDDPPGAPAEQYWLRL